MSEQGQSLDTLLVGPTPEGVRPYVRALGAQGALDFILKFGGQPIYIPLRYNSPAALPRAIGAQKARALLQVLGAGNVKVPTARAWVARQLDAAGASRADIANRLHVTRESVRLYLAAPKAEVSA